MLLACGVFVDRSWWTLRNSFKQIFSVKAVLLLCEGLVRKGTSCKLLHVRWKLAVSYRSALAFFPSLEPSSLHLPQGPRLSATEFHAAMHKLIFRPHSMVSSANVFLCSAVTVIEFIQPNTKHCFFWAWSPRKQTSYCSYLLHTFRAELVPVTGTAFV